jgi:Fic family protein
MNEINLDDWRWLREISGLDTEAHEHYLELARKNEALVVGIIGKDAYNIYIPEVSKDVEE